MAQPCQIYLNGEFYKETKQVVNVLYDLEPEKEYCVAVQKGEEKSEIVFCTEAQDYTLNVRDFGAKGDGIQDDTTYIQAAIMACPKNSRVLIPELPCSKELLLLCQCQLHKACNRKDLLFYLYHIHTDKLCVSAYQ